MCGNTFFCFANYISIHHCEKFPFLPLPPQQDTKITNVKLGSLGERKRFSLYLAGTLSKSLLVLYFSIQ